VQAVQAGVWRKGTRLRDLLVHALAARALAGKRVPATTGKKTPGVEGDLWDPPTQTAQAVARIGRWLGYRPAPLKCI
jgi:RNA-directed DNA polymerase